LYTQLIKVYEKSNFYQESNPSMEWSAFMATQNQNNIFVNKIQTRLEYTCCVRFRAI